MATSSKHLTAFKNVSPQIQHLCKLNMKCIGIDTRVIITKIFNYSDQNSFFPPERSSVTERLNLHIFTSVWKRCQSLEEN